MGAMAAVVVTAGALVPGAVVDARPALSAQPSGLAGTCTDGLANSTRLPPHAGVRALLRLATGGTLGVGWIRDADEGRAQVRTLEARLVGGEWTFSSSLATDGHWSSLERLARAPDGRIWGAGIRYQTSSTTKPRVTRRTPSGWQDVTITPSAGVATGLAIDDGGAVWVTTAETEGGRSVARLYERRSGTWRRVSLPSVPGVERFAGVATPSRTVTIVAGTTVSANGVRPVVLRRTGDTWVRETVQVEPGEHIQISDVVAGQAGPPAVVGWRLSPLPLRPVAFVRDPDGVWRPGPTVQPTGTAGLAYRLVRQPDKRLVIGTSFLAAYDRWVPAVGDPSTGAWGIVPQAGLFASAAVGDPTTDGWVALSRTVRAGPSSARPAVVTRLCDVVPVTDPAARRSLKRQHRAEVLEELAASRRAAASERRRSTEALERQGRRTRPAAAPAGALEGQLAFRDIAANLGLPVRTGSYGISQTDLDDDGDADLVWSRHGGALAIYLRDESGYQAFTPTGIVPADRHSCVAGRLDADATADIACVTGGQFGIGLTSNELYLDPTTGVTRDQGTERGLTDPTARGRRMVAFDADGDGDLDLYVANEERMDGAPVINRLLVNDGDANFTWSIDSRLTSSFGQSIPRPADLDGDGDKDLIVALDREGGDAKALHLYQNDGTGVFTDTIRGSGLAAIGETDLAVAQLDGSGRPEIIQLSPTRLVISRWNGERYVRVVDRVVKDAVVLAPADVDGDGDMDLYVASGPDGQDGMDLLLRNNGTGTGWKAISVPGTGGDHPDAILATDLDGDGRDEVILTAGRNRAGPFRVIDAVAASAP